MSQDPDLSPERRNATYESRGSDMSTMMPNQELKVTDGWIITAPAGTILLARSRTTTLQPSFFKATAADRPPIEPPTIQTSITKIKSCTQTYHIPNSELEMVLLDTHHPGLSCDAREVTMYLSGLGL